MIGYLVKMDQQDNNWLTVYDGGTNPTTRNCEVLKLLPTVTYRVRVFALNRIGPSQYIETPIELATILAAPGSYAETFPDTVRSLDRVQVQIRGVHPITLEEDAGVGGRTYVLAVHDRCEFDSQGVLLRRRINK